MRGVAKADLPTRDCAHCGRPFRWRKRWARGWETVKYCSEACRRGKVPASATAAAPVAASPTRRRGPR